MHGVSEVDFLRSISPFLGGYYLLLAGMNAVMAFHLWHNRHRTVAAIFWTGVAMLLVVTSAAAMGGSPPGLIPASTTKTVNDVQYTIATDVEYVDDPALGQPQTYVNYKRVTVTVTPDSANARPRNIRA